MHRLSLTHAASMASDAIMKSNALIVNIPTQKGRLQEIPWRGTAVTAIPSSVTKPNATMNLGAVRHRPKGDGLVFLHEICFCSCG